MPSNLVWRRCPTCGQLTLVPATANLCWQCGAPCPDPGRDPRPSAGGAPTTTDSAFPSAGVGSDLDERLERAPAARRSLPGSIAPTSRRPRVVPSPGTTLTAAEDAIARRLLGSVFPNGIEL